MEWLQSVYSDGTKYFVSNPLPKKRERITIQLRMKENNYVKNVILRSKEFGLETLHEMKPVNKKNGLQYYACDVVVRDSVFRYQFYLVVKDEKNQDKVYYYTQYRITDYIPEESNDFMILADYKAPSWVNQSVFYQIFPDRFFNGNPEISVKDGEYRYQGYETIQIKKWNTAPLKYEEGHNLDFYGGDLEGIIKKLDYLQQLGINAIYLNPIFLSPSNHKYDSLDYFRVDPNLGGEEALERLSEELHKRGMRLILDISINHTSCASKWFNKDNEFYDSSVGAYQNPDSKEREYYFLDENNNYDAWFGVKTMPKLNYQSSQLRDIIYRDENSVLKKWVRKPYQIDGWRFDVAECLARNEIVDVHREVLKEIQQSLKKEKEDLFLLAEDWGDCSEDLQGDSWDSTMNYYGCARPIREYIGEVDLFHTRNEVLSKISSPLTARQLCRRILQFYAKLPSIIQHQMFNLLDSHDVSRLHNNPKVSRQDYKAAVMMQFTLPGTPCIYYGDEILLDGSVETIEECRYPMSWEEQHNDLIMENYNFYQKLALLKVNSEALQDGGFSVLSEEGFCFAYARFTQDELILVICSVDSKESSVVLPIENFGLRSFYVKRDYFGTPTHASCKQGKVVLSVKPHESYLFVLKIKEDE